MTFFTQKVLLLSAKITFTIENAKYDLNVKKTAQHDLKNRRCGEI